MAVYWRTTTEQLQENGFKEAIKQQFQQIGQEWTAWRQLRELKQVDSVTNYDAFRRIIIKAGNLDTLSQIEHYARELKHHIARDVLLRSVNEAMILANTIKGTEQMLSNTIENHTKIDHIFNLESHPYLSSPH